MLDKGWCGVWPGCLLSTGLMALLLYLEAHAAHPPVVHRVVQFGTVVLCYYLAYKWVQAHPHVFLARYRQDAGQQEQRPEHRTGQSQSDQDLDQREFER